MWDWRSITRIKNVGKCDGACRNSWVFLSNSDLLCTRAELENCCRFWGLKKVIGYWQIFSILSFFNDDKGIIHLHVTQIVNWLNLWVKIGPIELDYFRFFFLRKWIFNFDIDLDFFKFWKCLSISKNSKFWYSRNLYHDILFLGIYEIFSIVYLKYN